MKPRERVKLALNHEEADHVPIDLNSTNMTGITKLSYIDLLDHLKISDEIEIIEPIQQLVRVKNEILDLFKVDTIKFTANPPSDWDFKITRDDRNFYFKDEWGITWKMPKESPRYFDFYSQPLSNLSIDEIKSYCWPEPDDKARFEGLKEKAKKIFHDTDKAIVAAHPNGPGIFELACWLTGMEEFLISMIKEKEKALSVLAKISEIYLKIWDNYLKEIGEFIDVCVISEDLGTQNGPMISLELFKSMVEPFMKELIELIKKNTDAKIFLHSCGDVTTFIPSLINIGVDILNPIQVSASNMGDTAKLKREYGKDLVFWGGGCDSQKILPFGSRDEVTGEVRKRINDLKKEGGFVFAPIHNIQSGIPPENIVAMYQAAIKYGGN